MSNPSTYWGRRIIAALATSGIDHACVAPGSRSTPLATAVAAHPAIDVVSLLDERSAGYYAVGRAKATGEPVAVISTSGTATANFHPAVMEADRSRTPLVVCTADRPAELHGSGANQTVTQVGEYGDAVRYTPTIPEAGDGQRRSRSLEVSVVMAVERSRGPLPGPVHLNIPFQKPLAPSPEDEPPNWSDFGQSSVPVVHHGSCEPDAGAIAMLADAIRRADRGIIVTGPCDPRSDLSSLEYLATEAGLPLLADPLSGVRFSGGSTDSPVIGGYDSYVATCPTPDLIIRAGARPVSEPLQRYLANHDGDHIVIDPCADYRDPRFSTTDIVAADPPSLVAKIVEAIDGDEIPSSLWEPFHRAEKRYWSLVEDDRSVLPPEGRVAYQTLQEAPPNASVYVSNSMPIRDVDRFGRPRDGPVTVLGNRGASGIDGIISAGIGGGVETDQSVILTGDLALYHDMNGLLAIDRTGIQPTIVVINNDGGGIFHKLPIEAIDPPFTELFKTPHGLDFKHAARLYDLEYHHTDAGGFGERYRKALDSPPALVEVSVDAERNHQQRKDFKETVTEVISEGINTA